MDKLKRTKKQIKKILSKRISAFIIDLYAISIISKLLIINYFDFMNNIFFITPNSHQIKAALSLSSLNFTMMLIVGLSYFTGFLYFNHGQTPGKLIFQLRTFRTDGPELSFFQCLLRTVSYFFSYMSAFAFIFAWPTFLSKNNRGIPCMISNTFTDIENYFEEVEKLTQSNKVNVIDFPVANFISYQSAEGLILNSKTTTTEVKQDNVIYLPYVPTEDEKDKAA